LALCLFIAGCGGGNGTSGPDAETDLGDADSLGPAEAINQAMADAGDGTETESTEGETATPTAEAGAIALSPDNTQIQFIGTHNRENLDPRTCEFEEFSGTATLDDEGSLAAVTVEIQTDSVTTFDQKLTNHLKNEEFLDVNVHPTILFETTGVETGEDATTLHGNLTLLGTTKPVSIPAEVSITDGKVSLSGSLKINRSEYGMDQNLDSVNDEVEIRFTVENAG
jgi:polyisoprenoid-binding protein YceI